MYITSRTIMTYGGLGARGKSRLVYKYSKMVKCEGLITAISCIVTFPRCAHCFLAPAFSFCVLCLYSSIMIMDSLPESCNRFYEDGDGWYADPLCKLWLSFDTQLLERLLSPMRCPYDERIHAKMQQLLSKHTAIHKEMFDLLNQLNNRDFILTKPSTTVSGPLFKFTLFLTQSQWNRLSAWATSLNDLPWMGLSQEEDHGQYMEHISRIENAIVGPTIYTTSANM